MTERRDKGEQAFFERVRRTLDESVDQLDFDTLGRLEIARRRALSEAAKPGKRWWRPLGFERDWLVPAGAFASIVATVLALTLMVSDPGGQSLEVLDDIELLTAGEDLELLENLEFYQWLPDLEQTG